MERMCVVCDKPMGSSMCRIRGSEHWAHQKCMGSFNRRADGRIEWVCSHGVGHTIWFPRGSNNVHGCCGCCSKLSDARYSSKRIL